MGAFKTPRGVAVVACLAMGLPLLKASGAVAASPVLSDPFIRQVELGEEEAGVWERFNNGGESVALSSEGNTALIGGGHAEWVYTRSGSTWTRQAKLNLGIGSSVALSGDGNTALIGEPGDNNQVGGAWVFRRTGSTWTQLGEKLTGRAEIGAGRFGASVALSPDGKTAVIGGPGDNEGVGAAWVFRRRGSTWAQWGSKLTGSDEIGPGSFGHSVALSSHGNTALIGGPGDNGGVGAAWVFRRTGSRWMQHGGKLTGGGEIGYGNFGSAVALSSDGNTALIGGDTDNESQAPEVFSYYGAAWVFTRSGQTWTQQGKKLTGGVAYLRERGFGYSVALSSDGNTALIGDPGAPYADFGLAWFFTRSGKTWTEEQETEGVEEEHPGQFGTSVALAADGNTALIGEPEAFHFWGAGLVFVRMNPLKGH
ncbi:MAG: hypothetical protein ACLQMH_06650 [Solirubrobacteraceae bacterium]